MCDLSCKDSTRADKREIVLLLCCNNCTITLPWHFSAMKTNIMKTNRTRGYTTCVVCQSWSVKAVKPAQKVQKAFKYYLLGKKPRFCSFLWQFSAFPSNVFWLSFETFGPNPLQDLGLISQCATSGKIKLSRPCGWKSILIMALVWILFQPYQQQLAAVICLILVRGREWTGGMEWQVSFSDVA